MTDTTIQKTIQHAHENTKTYMAGFNELLKIGSISTDPAFKDDLERCADWIIAEMDRIGFKNNRKIPTEGHPVVYGEWLEAGDDKPTVLVYAHYDVQPVEPLELWETPPFEPSVRDGLLFARGAIDDKCGVWGNLKAFESMLAVDGKLPVNVKIFFEGEEEIGSPNVQPFIAQNKDLLGADALILCDGAFDPKSPSINSAGRGVIAAEVIIRGPDHDLHSGTYGGAVHNPLHLAGKIIGSFHDDKGHIQIPGFYDRVIKVDETEMVLVRESWESRRAEFEQKSGVKRFWAESQGTLLERTTAWPTLDINGFKGGYQGPGMKTIIPAEASFKVTMRLVANQNPHEIAQMFKDYVLSFAPETLQVEVNILAEAWPMAVTISGPVAEAKIRTLEEMFGKSPAIVRGGGSLPIGGTFQHELGVPMVVFGFGAGENVHAPNEYLRIDDFNLAIDAAIHFYYTLAETMA